MPPVPAILVLGAPRSGTSCLAGMLAAAGAVVPGAQVRNWDNPRGHFEATAAVRLSEAVLARSGGSWLRAAGELRWGGAEAAERDRLLEPLGGRPALLKDPRILLCAGFWFAGRHPLALVGTVRHPLAVARSLASWRRLPLADGLRVWLDHARPLLELARRLSLPLLDFDAERAAFIAAVAELAPRLWSGLDPAAVAAHYDAGQVHHDGLSLIGDAPPGGLLAEAEGVHAQLRERAAPAAAGTARSFPWRELAAVSAAAAVGDLVAAGAAVRRALAVGADPVAVLVTASVDLLRAGLGTAVIALIAEVRPPPALAGLLQGKALLALGEPRSALTALETACAVPAPYFEARTLRAHARHACGQRREACHELVALAAEAVHPQQSLGTAAEWAWRDRDHAEALELYRSAIAVAPAHRRGRLRCRRAELLIELTRHAEALAELDAALDEDPDYARASVLRPQCSRMPGVAPASGVSR